MAPGNFLTSYGGKGYEVGNYYEKDGEICRSQTYDEIDEGNPDIFSDYTPPAMAMFES